MITDWIFLIFGILVWVEFFLGVAHCVGKNASYLSAFLSRPFCVPMPSVVLGIIMRALLIAVGSIGIANFF